MAGMDRRAFVHGIGGGCITALAPAFAQQPTRLPRIGYIGNNRPMNGAFEQALRQLGYVDGVTAVFEARFTDGHDERIPALASELVAAKVDVIVVLSGPAALAVKAATTTIPIVLVGVSGRVGRGIVASLAHPGGNITGIANLMLETNLKRLEILKEAVPKMSRVVTVGNWDATVASTLDQQDAEARARGFTVRRIALNAPSDIDSVLAAIAAEQPDGLMLLPVPLTYRLRKEFAGFALSRKLPTIEFIVNLATARQIGVTLPQSLLLRATEVLQ